VIAGRGQHIERERKKIYIRINDNTIHRTPTTVVKKASPS